MARLGAAIVVVLSGAATGASAAELSSRARSVVFLEVIATKGVECELLEAWQGLALRVQMSQEVARLSPQERAAVDIAVKENAAETSCDSPSITQWIGAAKPSFEIEMLPPFLLVYKAIAERDPRPALFVEATGGVDVTDMVSAIDAKIADYVASGSTAFEGGKSWREYRARTETQIEKAMETVLGPGMPDNNPLRRIFIYAIPIVHLWRETQ